MAEVQGFCGDCSQDVRVNVNEAAVNHYDSDRASDLRFTCPICEVVQLEPLDSSRAFALRYTIPEQHAITVPHDGEREARPPISEADAYDFSYKMKYTDDVMRELTPDERARARELHPSRSRRMVNFLGKVVSGVASA